MSAIKQTKKKKKNTRIYFKKKNKQYVHIILYDLLLLSYMLKYISIHDVSKSNDDRKVPFDVDHASRSLFLLTNSN